MKVGKFMRRKIYPSQRRYMEENPAISFRMKKAEKERIVEMAELAGKTISDLLRVALFDLEENFSETYKKAHIRGYNHGFQNAKRAYRIWNFCHVCGKAIDILPNSDAHKAIIDYLKKAGWGHPECH